MSDKSDSQLPFAGLRVLEYSQLIMAPVAGLILADLGAEVIKVEPAVTGDPTRSLKGFAAGFFPHFNRNKRSIGIDLKQQDGVDLVHRLVKTADIVIENYAPGTMDRLGCGSAELCKLNPRLIYCSLKGFLDGPYQNRPALDEVVQFMGALAYMTGPLGRPLRAGSSVVDLMGGTMGIVGILAALRERDRTGKGQIVKSGLFESTVFMMGQHMASSIVTNEPVLPMPEKLSAWGIYEIFETADSEQVFIAVTSDNHWRRFCKTFGREDLLNDARLGTNAQRSAARQWMVPIVKAMILALPKSEVVRLCDQAAVPFAPVSIVEDLFTDPHLVQSGALLDVQLGSVSGKLPRLPISLGDHEIGLRRNAPQLGADTDDILGRLGLATAEIVAMRARGTVS
jgi:crotonobetainyl-CoA:carnitine CoA-transferase CaiB-like acyl-CoA transferase